MFSLFYFYSSFLYVFHLVQITRSLKNIFRGFQAFLDSAVNLYIPICNGFLSQLLRYYVMPFKLIFSQISRVLLFYFLNICTAIIQLIYNLLSLDYWLKIFVWSYILCCISTVSHHFILDIFLDILKRWCPSVCLQSRILFFLGLWTKL